MLVVFITVLSMYEINDIYKKTNLVKNGNSLG